MSSCILERSTSQREITKEKRTKRIFFSVIGTMASNVIKLRLSELGLYGREEELALLKRSYSRIEKCCNDGADAAAGDVGSSAGVVFVSGTAGSGKSALVMKLCEDISNGNSGPLFVSGKFDDPRATTGQPYAALRRASGQLTKDIVEFCDETDRKLMGERINKALGTEGLDVLEKVVPGVKELVASEEKDTENTIAGSAISIGDVNRHSSTESLNRLKFALRSFLRSVASSSRPIVLFLDDLQWADQASLQLIRSIVTDTQLQHLLFIGAHREEEVDEEHPLAIMLRGIKEETLQKSITRIQLKNLDAPTVSKLVSNLLRLDESEIAELSEVVHQRTGGNAFFVLQFLDLLQDRGLLYYSLSSYKWDWDIEQIRAETDISDNVVELVANKIERLPQNAVAVLKLMASLPSAQVDVSFLEPVLQGLNMDECRSVR